MTILESSTVTGIDDRRHRVGDAALSSSVEQCAKDQAALHREIAGFDVPNAPGVSQATPHVHDGTDGVVVPIPVATVTPFATYFRHPGEGTADDKWTRVCFGLFYAQTSRVRVLLTTRTGPVDLIASGLSVQSLKNATLDIQDEALFRTFGPELRTGGGPFDEREGVATIYADVDVTADAWNAICVWIWDGYYKQGETVPVPEERNIDTVTVLPTTHGPGPVPLPYSPPTVTSTDVQVPDSRYPSESGAYAYVSTDDGMVGDDRAMSSYLAVSAMMNDALLSEVLDGRPAGSNAEGHSNDASYAGHCHGGSSSDYDLSGADMVHNLGSWSYGVPYEPSTQRPYGTLYARICPRMPGDSSLTWRTIAQHRFRMPRVSDSSGASTNIQAAAIVYANPGSPASGGPHSDSRFGVHIKDSAGSGGPGSRDESGTISATTAWQMVTISNVDEADDTSERKLVRVEVESQDSEADYPMRIAACALAYIP